MASLDGIFTVTSNEYRPCTIYGKRAIFHQWVEHVEPVGASLCDGGTPAGQARYVLGLVEYENGCTEEVKPGHIMFVDDLCKRTFAETATTDDERWV